MKFSYKWNGKYISEERVLKKVGEKSLAEMKRDTEKHRSRCSWVEEGERYSVNWGFQTQQGLSEDTLTITIR